MRHWPFAASLGSWRGLVLAGLMAGLSGCGDHNHGHIHAGGGTSGGHHHGSAHGGVAVELGEHQYQLDLLHDGTAGTLTAWVMDGHMEGFVKIAAPEIPVTVATAEATNALSLKAVANAATEEKVGDTSHFQGQSDVLRGAGEFRLIVPLLEIRGARYTNVVTSYATKKASAGSGR